MKSIAQSATLQNNDIKIARLSHSHCQLSSTDRAIRAHDEVALTVVEAGIDDRCFDVLPMLFAT